MTKRYIGDVLGYPMFEDDDLPPTPEMRFLSFADPVRCEHCGALVANPSSDHEIIDVTPEQSSKQVIIIWRCLQ